MVEEGGEGDTLAQDIACHEIDREGARALCRLGERCLNASYQRLVVAERQVQIECQIIRHTTLLATDLQDLIEICNLITGAERHLLGGRLHDLTRR